MYNIVRNGSIYSGKSGYISVLRRKVYIMAVPFGNGHLLQSDGSTAWIQQSQGGVALGNRSTAGPLSKVLGLDDSRVGRHVPTGPKQRTASGGTYNATVANSAATGAFAYDQSANNKWIMRGLTRTLSGASNTSILSGSAPGRRNAIHAWQHDFGVGLLAMWRGHRFSHIGRLKDGTAISSRLNWLDADHDAASTPGTLTGVFMHDISDGNATDRADDDALPTRAVPGELVFMINFTDLTSSGQGYNKIDYKAVTV